MILPLAHNGTFRGEKFNAGKGAFRRSNSSIAGIDRADIVRVCILLMCACGGYFVGHKASSPTYTIPVSASAKVCGASMDETVDAFTQFLKVDMTRAMDFLDDDFEIQVHTSEATGNVAILYGREGFQQLTAWWSEQFEEFGDPDAVSVDRRKVLNQYLDPTSKVWINEFTWELGGGLVPNGTETYLLSPGNCIWRLYAFMAAGHGPIDLPGNDVFFTLKMLEYD
eukprot:GEMP01044784.1.p1 GENE.GEMP01044784.1~~GEMP01044784.1.p1  ORF type:complete len:225 (+),score=32.63 GEMP01044784.1:95-769(+)